MKSKKGFTLAEVIIAVGVIGVMAALMATALHQAMPDQTRFMFLKAYDGLTEAVVLLADNDGLFNKEFNVTDIDGNLKPVQQQHFPFLDTTKPDSDTGYSNDEYKDKFKFAKLLREALKGEDDGESPDGKSYIFKSGPGNYTWTVTPIGATNGYNLEYISGFSIPVFTGLANKVKLKIGNDDDSVEYIFCVQPDGEIRIVNDLDSAGRKGLGYIQSRHKVRGDVSATSEVTSCTAKQYYQEGSDLVELID